jgi:hypothetical protein
MRSALGMASDLLHLTDDDIISVVEQWRRLHPVREQDDDLGFDYFDTGRFEAIKEELVVRQEVVTAIEARLSKEALAELEAMLYLERDHVFAEYHESMIARVLKEHAAVKDPKAETMHLMENTNFLQCVGGAAGRLGRQSLAERLKAM